MKDFTLATPVLMLAFNRPDLTQRVFDQVKLAKPADLYFAANHPETSEDKIKSGQVRDILKQVDWDCRVHTLFPPSNTGSTWGPINAINWIFEHSETAIILEDDCVPDPSFFRYCQELLGYWRDDEKIFGISGVNYLNPNPSHKYSYWFSPLTATWGWASWRRSWKKVDFNLPLWPKLRETNWLEKKIGSNYIAAKYRRALDRAWQTRGTKGFIGGDYTYNLTMLLYNALEVRPAVNLVSNLGFREDASHSTKKTSFADFPTRAMQFPLKHPPTATARPDLEILFCKQTDPNFYPWRETIKKIPLIRNIIRAIKS